MNENRQDPAERGWLRLYYRNWRPTLLGKLSNRVWAWLAGLGVLPPIVVQLQVRDRHDGGMRSTVLVPVDLDGHRYLVSMLGHDSDWVQNIRAARGDAWIKRGQTVPVRLSELPVSARAPILKAWCAVATSGRQHLPVAYDAPLATFQEIATDYPVFRIDPDGRSPACGPS